MERTYEFINGITIPYLTYWTYAHMGVVFANLMQSFKVMQMTCNILMDTSTKKRFTRTQSSVEQFLIII